jgi:hypothetical protein
LCTAARLRQAAKSNTSFKHIVWSSELTQQNDGIFSVSLVSAVNFFLCIGLPIDWTMLFAAVEHSAGDAGSLCQRSAA